MSHVVKVALQIRDLDALSEACESLGLELGRGETSFRRFGGKGRCDHRITIPGNPRCYEIGVVRSSEAADAYDLSFDPWQGGYGMMAKVGGEKCPLLRRNYAEKAAIRKMESLGYVHAKETLPGDRVKLVFSRPASWVAVQQL